jgi:hypothetical protein
MPGAPSTGRQIQVPARPRGHSFLRRDQLRRGHAGEPPGGAAAEAELGQQALPEFVGLIGAGDVLTAAAGRDRATDQAARQRRGEQVRDAFRARRHAVRTDPGRVAAERRDVGSHPAQGRDLIHETRLSGGSEVRPGRLAEVQETE